MNPFQTREMAQETLQKASRLLLDVEQEGPVFYSVPGTTGVRLEEGKPFCQSCRGHDCEHTLAVQLLAGLAETESPPWSATPQQLGFAEKFTDWRPLQTAALERILNSDKRFILLEAPTGSGKSLIAAAAQRLLDAKTLYCCTTLALQDQFVADFPAALLKGRANYPCAGAGGITCRECAWTFRKPTPEKNCRPDCPYLHAKARVVAADLGVLNTTLFLYETNLVGELAPPGKLRQFVIIDEADHLEETLRGFIELYIPKRYVGRFKLSPPDRKTKQETWGPWAERLIEILDHRFNREQHRMEVEEALALQDLLGRLRYFLSTLSSGVWVNTTSATDWETGPWRFRPALVSPFAEQKLWRHGQRWILMSATLLSVDQVCRDLGIARAEVDFIRLPSTFSPERRPVYYSPVVPMSYKTREAGAQQMRQAVLELLLRHRNQKVLIHSVSYWLAEKLEHASIPQTLYNFGASQSGREALETFRRDPTPSVLLGPGLERGVDLPYDACDVVIIPKVPYPSLGDKQVSARLYSYPDGKQWYALQTVRSIVQASGRAMRHADDTSTTYILDANFSGLYRDYRHLFPSWWRSALVKGGNGLPRQ